jgi:capsular exopolysaccharide synthesis family protein
MSEMGQIGYEEQELSATRTDTAALLGQVMFLVAVALGFLALGSWIGRDMSEGAAMGCFFAGFGMLIVANFVERLRVGMFAVVWLYAIALLLGLGLAGGLVFLRDQMDDRLRVPEDVEAKLGLPLLGVIPRSKEEDPHAELSDPKSILSESYNALRTSLLYSTRDGLPGILLVTSAQASEGKTTTSYATARGFARVGKRVLLMDADLRRPSIHKVTGVANGKGLSSLLVGQSELHDSVKASEFDGLDILPAGPIPPSPAELLSSPRMAALLEQLDHAYDLVVIDSAPILGLADSTELAALADGVMLVVEADRGGGGQLKNALRRLRGSNPVLLGAVLTKFDPKRAGNAYYSYYGYEYYRYGDGEDKAA